jgi:hypothetical protein
LALGCLGHHGFDADGLAVGSDDAQVFVSEDLPMLVLVDE